MANRLIAFFFGALALLGVVELHLRFAGGVAATAADQGGGSVSPAWWPYLAILLVVAATAFFLFAFREPDL